MIKAASVSAAQRPKLQVLIGGTGRDSDRLNKLIKSTRAPVKLIGRVSDEALPRFYGCADVSAMLCRSRWGGLEQEGFGIVFSEAAACGVPQIAGDSGGAAEAVVDGVTGIVVSNPESVDEVVVALNQLLSDPAKRTSMGEAARIRACAEFDYDVLSARLADVLGVDK